MRVQKRVGIQIPLPIASEISLPFKFEHIRLQAAVYNSAASLLRLLLSKPVLVVNLNDPSAEISEDAFSAFMKELMENEEADMILAQDGSDEPYRKYGFEAVSKSIWSLFYLSRVRQTFIFWHDKEGDKGWIFSK